MWAAFVLVFIIGVLSRIVDMATSDGLRLGRPLGYFLGAIYGFLIAYVIGNYPALATLSLVIVASILVAGKVDHPFHYAGMASLVFFLLIYGIGQLEPILGIIFMAGAVTDEVGNGLSDRGRIKGFLGVFFRYRLTMELLTLIVSLLTGRWELFVAMVAYDLGFSYIFTDRVRGRLINIMG